ncbi:dipeptidase [Streptacidiphilus neutrinimicus]|uniref:dipeptidase n=1 Tax=Streptacidiphilus neutrinimicus TaxID=105420 RepID=UPI000AFE3F5A|nr:dipeptidase [Streptacidiphilus neutrinimicus]
MASSVAPPPGGHMVTAEQIAAWMPQAERDLQALVALPSVADPQLYDLGPCSEASRFTARALRSAGLMDVRVVDVGDAAPTVVGRSPAPPGAPTVLLYAHYDVQPPGDLDEWRSPPFELSARGGRWYGRGAADCKGNVVAHLTALRTLGERLPVGVTVLIEGAEEQSSHGLTRYVTQHPSELHADAVIIGDSGGAAEGIPALTVALRGVVNLVVSVTTMRAAVHSGMFGGPAPDALAALIRILDSLYDARGNTVIEGVPPSDAWHGAPYPDAAFRREVGLAEGVQLMGTGSVAERLWARPAVTVLGIDCPRVVGSSMSVSARARARVSLRIPPGVDTQSAAVALTAHLQARAPWHAQVSTQLAGAVAPVQTPLSGTAHVTAGDALALAYGRPPVLRGDGRSVPVCAALAETLPSSEMVVLGVEEPACRVHAPNESVAPAEIARIALSEALFLQTYAQREGNCGRTP